MQHELGFERGYKAFATSKKPLFGEFLRLAAKDAMRQSTAKTLADKLDFEHGFTAGAKDAAKDDGWETGTL